MRNKDMDATNQRILTTINHIPIIRNHIENLPYNVNLKKLASGKRKARILSEVLFWQQVHKGNFTISISTGSGLLVITLLIFM